MHKTIIVTNKVKQIMYSTQTPPFIRVVLRPPPVAEKGSIALSEITSIYSLLSGYKIKYSRHTKVNLERDWLFLF